MRGYKLALLYAYFQTGYGITSYIKYLIAFFGLASQDIKTTMIFAFLYAISCFFVGWFVYHSGFAEAQAEVANQYNLFVKEMRKKVVKSAHRKT